MHTSQQMKYSAEGFMLKQLPDFLNLGLRPSGQFELVDVRSGEVSFSPTDPGGEPLDLIVNPQDVPFAERPRSFLTTLREQRVLLLVNHRRAKALNRKKVPSDSTVKSPRKRTTKSSVKLAASISSLEGKLSSDVLALLRDSLR